MMSAADPAMETIAQRATPTSGIPGSFLNSISAPRTTQVTPPTVRVP